ncbi:hypothetical protein M8831_03150 [Pseudomonas aeruginosa]|uniref:hypothetical protein n=1 Tax=Pseudomonas aeruginosa TaxID=287 RepID=UPI002021D926|nr:hypothetical protein [Pseudomonas aeruginosa]MCL8028351.1 hypothetical protein [Pseudomonas aeruginosa]
MSKELNKASVEQAGGDERAAFEAWLAQAMSKKFEPEFDLAKYEDSSEYRYSPAAAYWKAWQARAALAQPSPASDLDPFNLAPHAEAFNEAPAEALKSDQAEAERPEVAEVAFVLRNIGAMDAEDIDGDNVDLRFEDAEGRDTGCDVSIVEYAEKAADLLEQHASIVGELRAKADQLREALEWRKENQAGQRELLRSVTAERDAALARVAELESKLAELEKQEPVALANRGNQCFWVKWTEAAAGLYGPGIKLYAAPVAQAQQLNDLDKQCRDDVARALGLRPNQERGFAWSYLLASIKSCVKASEDSAQAQHCVPEGVTIERDVAGTIHIKVGDFDFIQLQYQRPYTDNASTWKLAERIASLLAAAPGTEVPQAWLDVQAERSRQITAEGWTPDHDDLYCAAELPRAAAAYILSGANDEAPAIWPFSAKWWKPRDARANYMRAGALILAEIERLDRAAERGKEVGHE